MKSTRVTPTLSLAVAVKEIEPLLPVTAALTLGAVVSTLTLLTVKLTVGDTPALPAASYATADSVWLPFASAVESISRVYVLLGSLPVSTPSTMNSTSLTPTLSLALAIRVTIPLKQVTDASKKGALAYAIEDRKSTRLNSSL